MVHNTVCVGEVEVLGSVVCCGLWLFSDYW